MKLFLDRLFRAFIALLIWPAICIGILIVDMAMIWKMDKPNKPKPASPCSSNHNCTHGQHDQHDQEHMDVAGGNPTKVATDNTGKIDWDEVSVYYQYKNGNS